MLIATASGIVDETGRPVLAERPAGAMATRSGDGRVLAVVDGSQVHELVGGVWHERAQLGLEVTCVAPLPDGGALAGTAGAYLWRIRTAEEGGGVEAVDSFDQAPTRDEWYTPWGGPADTRSLAAAGDGTILVNVHVGGILRSTDGGATWSPTVDLHDDVHDVRFPEPDDRPSRAVAAAAVGVLDSDDGGTTWTLATDGLHATYCRAVAVAGDTLLVSASEGPGGRTSRIYRRPLDRPDRAFEACDGGLPADLGGNVDTGWLAGSREGRAALVTADGRLFASDDAGATWDEVASDLRRPAWLLLDDA